MAPSADVITRKLFSLNAALQELARPQAVRLGIEVTIFVIQAN
jgi:hypothetical protein